MGLPKAGIDFDGVCHKYDSPWVDEKTIPDGPVPGLFPWLEQMVLKFECHIFSSRSKTPAGIEAMKNWFTFHARKEYSEPPFWLRQLRFPAEKQAFFISIDDRAYQFNGIFPDPEELLKFRPWNKRKQSLPNPSAISGATISPEIPRIPMLPCPLCRSPAEMRELTPGVGCCNNDCILNFTYQDDCNRFVSLDQWQDRNY